MSDPGDRGSDLYDSDMGEDVTGGSVNIGGARDDGDHVVVHGDDRHFSYDVGRGGEVSRVHGTEHSHPNRPW